jgi:hypothetical protein
VDQTFDTISSNIGKYLRKNQFVNADLECKKGISYLYMLHSTRPFEKERDDLKTTDVYKKEIQKQQNIKELEKQLRNEYLQNFFSGDSAWWSRAISALNAKISDKSDLITEQMYSRIKGFLGIVCYSYTSKAIASNNIELTNKCLKIYEALEPKNPDLFFYKALVLDKTNQPDKAVIMLKTALNYGYTDKDKIREQFSGRVLNALKH